MIGGLIFRKEDNYKILEQIGSLRLQLNKPKKIYNKATV